MKYIQKSIKNEPKSLKEERSTPNPNFDSCNKDDIRKALLNEQAYICAYCMRRIDNNRDEKAQPNIRIEHFEGQKSETGEDLRLNFLNMLGVCNGNEGSAKHLLTCDKRRASFQATEPKLSIDPRKKNCEQLINYLDNGTIYAVNDKIDYELNNLLGLNNENLVRERLGVIKTARQRMLRYYKKKKKDQSWAKSDLTKEIKYWNTQKNSKYPEYCRIPIFYLEKKLARL